MAKRVQDYPKANPCYDFNRSSQTHVFLYNTTQHDMTCCITDSFCDTSGGRHMNCKTTEVEGIHVTGFKVIWRQGLVD
jgi:hypothetical protein